MPRIGCGKGHASLPLVVVLWYFAAGSGFGAVRRGASRRPSRRPRHLPLPALGEPDADPRDRHSGIAARGRRGDLDGRLFDQHPDPDGLVDGSELPTPIFTPATKAAIGDHDINIDFDSAAAIVGLDHAQALREYTLKLYATATEFASSRGIILADTKFEFGIDNSGEITLGDEALTPDSSRFWDATNPGASFDKQFVRDYLSSSGWDKKSPPPELPAEIIEKTAQRYHQAYYTITGSKF